MRVVLCCLAKNEHLYINDFVKHYLKIGFDKIYIYDNDDPHKPFIGDYIDDKNRVEIIDKRGIVKPRLQQELYTEFYNTHDFDWVFYCDIDEFLFGINNIKAFLEQRKFMCINQIRVKWKVIGDDGFIERDMTKPVYEVFTHEIKGSWMRDLQTKGNLESQGKAFVRGHLNNVVVTSPHFASYGRRDNVIPSMLPSGKLSWSKVVITEDYSRETIFLYHYMTKSLSEFVNQKLSRTDAVDGNMIKLDYYWRINKRTPEKEQWLKNMGLIK